MARTLLADRTGVQKTTRKPLWTAVAGAVGAAAWAWHRDREQRQSAERLAAATLEALLNAVDANDEVTGRHMRRTAAYALCLAESLGLSDVERRKVERVALFHDIGKIHAALFDIVHDDSKLSAAERARVATHPQRGAEVLTPLAAFYPELPAGVLAHHERWDGTGYPNRLAGRAIPLPARIVAIADTFDAVTHTRRYHRGEDPERGWRVIAEGRGTQFDPDLVDAFLSPSVRTDVQRTLEHAADIAPARPQARRARRFERRAAAVESSAPDVRFRWRAPSPVSHAPADNADDRAGDESAPG